MDNSNHLNDNLSYHLGIIDNSDNELNIDNDIENNLLQNDDSLELTLYSNDVVSNDTEYNENNFYIHKFIKIIVQYYNKRKYSEFYNTNNHHDNHHDNRHDSSNDNG